MSLTADDWREVLDVGVDWMNGRSFALQVDSNDLVHVTDIDEETGYAIVRVFASTHPDAVVLFEGTVNVQAHLTQDTTGGTDD